jgi:hypothetical protein
MLFTFKREFQKMSVDLQIAIAGKTRLAESQWLEEQLYLNSNIIIVTTTISTI